MRAKVVNEIRKSRIPYVKGGLRFEEILKKVIELDKIIDETAMFGTTSHDLRRNWRYYREGLPTGTLPNVKWDLLDYEELVEAYNNGIYFWNNSLLDPHLFDKLRLPERFFRKIKDDHFNIINKEIDESFTYLKPKTEEEIRSATDDCIKEIEKMYKWLKEIKMIIVKTPTIMGSTYGFVFKYNNVEYSYYYDGHKRKYIFIEHRLKPHKIYKSQYISPELLRNIILFSLKLPNPPPTL